MDFGQAFSYQFKDAQWFRKLIIPGLITLIPIVGQIFLLGWALEITRRIIHHEMDLLPELDFGANLSKGFQAFVIALVYSIPFIIFLILVTLVNSLDSANNLNSGILQTLMFVTWCCCGGILFIYGIALGLYLPAALGNFVVKGGIGAGFQFSEIFAMIKAAPVAYLLVLVGGIVAKIIGGLGLVVCIIGVILTAPYAYSMLANLYGQAYLQAAQPR